MKWWCDVCRDKEGIFYIIRCFNKDEEFIKVGITCTSIKNRYRKKTLMPYNYQILYEIKSFNLKSLYKIEAKIKKEIKPFLYTPKISFGGSKTECFTRVPNALEEYENALCIGEETEEEHLIASAWNAVAKLEIYLRNKVK